MRSYNLDKRKKHKFTTSKFSKMIKLNDEEFDREDILKAVHLLDIFTKTYCRYRNDYERFDDLTFRCDECPFQKRERRLFV